MIPVLTPSEMAEVDAGATEPVEVLVDRAGAAVAHEALEMMGGAYGRRVVVLAGKGNNGADGRVAARRLSRRGARVEVIDAALAPATLPDVDLVIDAAYGTGFRGAYTAPSAGRAPVLAVDIPSGVSGLTGEAGSGVLAADRTVTFAALKPGLLFEPGRSLAGAVGLADVGLDVGRRRTNLLEASDVAALVPVPPADGHKWRAAVLVVAGSPGLTGAAHLSAAAAQRAGAGMVRLATPGLPDDPGRPMEAVGLSLPHEGWVAGVLEVVDRFGALVVGPGLGTGPSTAASVRELLGRTSLPAVVDGDALTALGPDLTVLGERGGPTVLTPHDGEHARLTGAAPGADRIAAARHLAAAAGAVVLLKGPTTVVADPAGEVLVVVAGDSRLATAGTGDVLSGVIGALLARGVPPMPAAAGAAWIHGRAARLGPREGMVAGDLLALVPTVLSGLRDGEHV